jgi:hypothetical protein
MAITQEQIIHVIQAGLDIRLRHNADMAAIRAQLVAFATGGLQAQDLIDTLWATTLDPEATIGKACGTLDYYQHHYALRARKNLAERQRKRRRRQADPTSNPSSPQTPDSQPDSPFPYPFTPTIPPPPLALAPSQLSALASAGLGRQPSPEDFVNPIDDISDEAAAKALEIALAAKGRQQG